MTNKALLIAASIILGILIWFVTAALILREESAFIPALNLIGMAALGIGILMGRRLGARWLLVFPAIMVVAALCLNVARYYYAPEPVKSKMRTGDI